MAFLADTRNRTAAKGTLLALLLVVAATGCVFGPKELDGWEIAVVNQSSSNYVLRADGAVQPRFFPLPVGAIVVVSWVLRESAGWPESVSIMPLSCDAVLVSAPTPSDVGTTVTINADGSATSVEGRTIPPGIPYDATISSGNPHARRVPPRSP